MGILEVIGNVRLHSLNVVSRTSRTISLHMVQCRQSLRGDSRTGDVLRGLDAMHPHIFLFPLSIPANCAFFQWLQANFALQEHCLHKICATMVLYRKLLSEKWAYP